VLQSKVAEACKKAALQKHLEGRETAVYVLGKKVGLFVWRGLVFLCKLFVA
jgi:hypothetical protein